MRNLSFLLLFFLTSFALSESTTRLTHNTNIEYHLNWSPDGQLISHTTFVNNKYELWYTRVGTGESVKIPVAGNLTGDLYNAWLPDSRTLLFDAYNTSGLSAIFRIGIEGGEAVQLAPPVCYMATVSPDGDRFAYMHNDDIWIRNINGDNPQRLTTHSAMDYHPNWSKAGNKVLFTSLRSGNEDIWYIDLDTMQKYQVTHNPAQDDLAAWSPDGSRIAFVSWRENNDSSIWLINADGTDPVRIPCEYGDSMPAWSPDGSRIAYASQRNGQGDIYIYNLSGTGVSGKAKPVHSFQLYDNFPNPFNPQTQIRFSLTEPSHVTLSVYNTLGTLVTTLVNDYHVSGVYSVPFDGSELTSGIYYYQLEIDGQSICKKMLLLK